MAEACRTREGGKGSLQKNRGLRKKLEFYFKGNRKSLENLKQGNGIGIFVIQTLIFYLLLYTIFLN